jgi:phenylacetate-CoA ligase
VRVERRIDVDTMTAAVAARELKRAVKHRIGVTIEVEVAQPHALERSLGKAKRIIDERPR